METVSIEKKTFEELMAQWDAFEEKVTALQRKGDGKRLARWLTGDEVCNRLRISQRTLQKLRQGIHRLFTDRAQVLLQAGRGQAADSACRHNPPRRQITEYSPLNPK